jgi:GT2 family glycosyltransferase
MGYHPRYAVITAHNRPDHLTRCVASLADQVDRIYVIDNASDPPIDVPRSVHHNQVIILRDDEQPPNLSRLWNRGIDVVASMAATLKQEIWDIGIFNDDVVVPSGWFHQVAEQMRQSGASVSCTHSITPLMTSVLKTVHDNDPGNRLCGWAFIMPGERNMRLDESFRWWFGDTDLDWRARQDGGMLIARGPVVPNTAANVWTNVKSELGAQAGQDRLTFAAKWGAAPW